MLAEGNSEPQTCAFNLLATMQREVPFRRSKGIDPDVLDMPLDEAESYLDESARDALDYYEPRVDAGEVVLGFGEDGDGSDGGLYVDVVSLGDGGEDGEDGDFEDEADDLDWQV